MFAWLIVATVLFLLVQYQFSYWKRRRFPQLNPSFPFGDVGQFFRMRACLGETYATLYESSKKLPFVGIYFSFRPMLLINDPELVQNVLVRDFEHFHDRGLHADEQQDPLACYLFALASDKWRHLRAKLTPAFSSGRLKGMFPNVVKIGRVMQKYIERQVATAGGQIDVHEVMGRYSTDIIASVGFGIENDSINEDDNLFRRMGSKCFETDLVTILRWAGTFFMPKLKAVLGFKCIAQDIEDFMIGIVRETLEHRESSGEVRKDMMQLLLQLRNSGTVSIDERWDVEVTTSRKKLTLEQITANAFAFFLAGFETSSSTISFCLHELAKNPEILRKAQQEIDAVLSRSNGEITYDDISGMEYLDKCIDETLRKYPPVAFLNRECTKDYEIPGHPGVFIAKGTSVIIPAMGLQRDPDIYPEPMRFVPERFNREKHLAFGDGPRICIGLRLGKMQTKVGLVMVLSKFDIKLADERQRCSELALDARGFVLHPVGGFRLVITKRQ